MKGHAPQLRLVTWNLAHGRGGSFRVGWVMPSRIQRTIEAAGQWLARADVDVACVQEIDETLAESRSVQPLSSLHASSGLEHLAFGPTNARPRPLVFAYGNAILSRLPLERTEHQRFGRSPLGEKGFQYAEVRVDAHCWQPVVNCHLGIRGPRTRLRHGRAMLRHLRALPHAKNRLPPIVAGDFNATDLVENDAMRLMLQELHAWGNYQHVPTDEATYPASRPWRRLDFVLIPACWELVEHEVPAVRHSDHRPVCVTLRLRSGVTE